MNKLPAFLFYPGDWLKDPSVSTLDYFEKGVYITLLCFAFQRGGKLLLGNDGSEPMNSEDISKLLGLEQTKADKVITSLVRHGCLKKDDSGCYYNSRMVRDAEIIEIRRENGQKGGKMKAKNRENTLQNSSEPPSKTLANGKQNSSLSYSYSSSIDISNSLSPACAKTNGEGEAEGETNGFMIEPPPGMPRNEDDAIAMAEMAGVPADFVRERAYPKIISIGFRDGNTTIRHFGQWAKLYFSNWQNQEKRHQKTTQPFERKDNYMYNSKIKLPEL
jgi:hypothetical protein